MKINDLKIKHYIFTRFSNLCKCKEMEANFLSEARLAKKLDMYKSITYKSLKSQTNQNFINLVMVHDEIPPIIYNELLTLSNEYPNIRIIKNSEIGAYSNNEYIAKDLNLKEFDFLITSRLDDDDMLYCGAIEDIHNSINTDTLIKYFGFKNGCTLDYDTKELFQFNKKSDEGLISIGISMIVNLNVYGILPFNVYWGHHSRMKPEFIEIRLDKINETQPLEPKYLNSIDFWEAKSTPFPAWVYTRHNESKSAAIGRFKEKKHYSTILVDKTIINEKFFKYFV